MSKQSDEPTAAKQRQLTPGEIVEQVLGICREYQRGGMDLTVRQAYYQLVSRALIGNGQKEYKRIVAALSAARLTGDFPLDLLVDRSRAVGESDTSTNLDDVESALLSASDSIRYLPYWHLKRSRWWRQPVHVSVWVEKEALAGVFEKPCEDLGVGLFACKGYPSHSSLYQWLRETHKAFLNASEENPLEKAVILYYGDHDPDGFCIPRSAEETLRSFQELNDLHFRFRVKRIGLNYDQIQQYNPPPFPAKVSSARYTAYVEEHGTDDAWELDALEPSVLRRSITNSVESYFDKGIHTENTRIIQGLRDEMRAQMRDSRWLDEALADL